MLAIIQARILMAALILTIISTSTYASVILDNNIGPINRRSGPFGADSTTGGEAFETFGQVFTAPITGALSSFTLSLKGGVGSLYGGVGTWDNANRKSPANLYQSSSVLSPGPAFIDIPVSAPFDEPNTPFTFYPSVSVIAGQQYIAYLSVFGDPVADRYALVYGSDDIVAGIGRFFALNDAAPNDPGQIWARGTTLLFNAVFDEVPEPGIMALLSTGLIGLGKLRRQVRT